MIKKLFNLNLFEIKYLVSALFYLPIIGLKVKKTGFRKTKDMIENKYPSTIDTVANVPANINVKAAQIGSMVCIAARWGPYRANCLKRALVIYLFLLRLGSKPKIIIGTKTANSTDFEAHAWVELNDVPIGEMKDVRMQFSVFD